MTNILEPLHNRKNRKNKIISFDLLGGILFLFIVGTMTIFGKNQLRIIGIVLAGSYSVYFLKEKKWVPKEIILLFLWLIWAFMAGYLKSIEKDVFLANFFTVLQITIMSFSIVGITAYRRNMNINLFAVCTGGIVLMVFSVIIGDFTTGINHSKEIRVQGITTNSNYYGYSILFAIASSLYFWKGKISWKRRALIIFLILTFTASIILSGSRKAFIGLIVLICLWLFMCYKPYVRKKYYLFIAFLFVLGTLLLATDYMMSNTLMGERFKEDLIERPIVERTDSYHRIILYKEGYAIIKNNLILGVGLGNFAVLSTLNVESHSDYVEVFVSTGIIGFTLYFSIYILLWRRMNRIQKIVKDSTVIYNIGLLKAVVVTILIVAIGRPNLTCQITWVILSSAIGYTWSLERTLFYLKVLGLNTK